jgi:hypothetical protein
MKFSKVLLEYLIEQVNNNPDFGFNPPADDENGEDEGNGEDNGEGDVENNDDQNIEQPDQQNIQPADDTNRPVRPPEQLGVKRRVKLKWSQEVLGLDLESMDDAIEWFNRNKNSLVALPTVNGDINTDPAIRVMPEVFMLHERFPDFPVFDLGKLRDITSYTWEQLQYLIDRFNTQITRVSTEIDEDVNVSPEEQREVYFNRWRTQSTKIIDDGDFIVHKVECVAESINLGKFQHWINNKYDPENSRNPANNWCITRPLNGGNYYSNYRPRRSYYFLYDGSKREDDDFYVSVLQPINPNAPSYRSEFPYTITKRRNKGDDLTGLEWEQIVEKWPKLNNKQHMFKFFGPTRKEDISAVLNAIKFTHPNATGTTRYDQSTDFVHQDGDIKLAYVSDPVRSISSIRAFKSLSNDLQKFYINATNLDNYNTRFLTTDSNDPFAILKYITKTNLKTLEVVMKQQLHVEDGVRAIKNAIITVNYIPSFGDYKYDNLRLYESKSKAGTFGILNLDNQTWALPPKFTKMPPQTYYQPNNPNEGKNKFLVYPYSADDGDGFYVIMPYHHLSQKTSPPSLFHKGRIFKKENIASKLALLTKLGNN